MLKPGQRIRVPVAEGAIAEATFLAPGEQSQAEWVEDARCDEGGRWRDVGWIAHDDGATATRPYADIRRVR
jgi:hypothetical protein